MSARYWLLVIFIGALWGCSFLFNAILLREIGPLWISAGRVSIGALGCWVYFFATRRKLPTHARLYWQLLVLGLLNYAIPFALFPLAEINLPSGLVGVISAMTPMTTVIVSQLWPGGERTSWNKSIGVVVGFLGAAVLLSPSLGTGALAQAWAVGAAMLATLCYAVTLNYARNFKGIDSTTIASISLSGAALFAVPAALAFEGMPVITLPETWAALFGIGLVSSSFAFLLAYWLIPRVGATNFSINTFISPISAILLGALVLDERLQAAHVAGALVIFIGLLFIDGRLMRWLRRAPV